MPPKKRGLGGSTSLLAEASRRIEEDSLASTLLQLSRKPTELINSSYATPVLLSAVINRNEDENVYCICRKADDGLPMVQCSACDEWYHLSCMNLKQSDVRNTLIYTVLASLYTLEINWALIVYYHVD